MGSGDFLLVKDRNAFCIHTRNTLSVGFLCLILFSAARAQSKYGVTDLSTLGGSTSASHAINVHGDVAGESDVSNGDYHAFLYSGGKND